METSFTQTEIQAYLEEAHEKIRNKRYTISLNSRRSDNRSLFTDYLLTEEQAEQILLSLTVWDFSNAVRNEHSNFPDETLYVFGKEVELIDRYTGEERTVPLYIKFNNLANGGYLIVISFHMQNYPLSYMFK